jgi:pimeloyl-ACP methyl ester carboxylesterase
VHRGLAGERETAAFATGEAGRDRRAITKRRPRCHWGDRDRTIPFERYGRPLLTSIPQAEHVVLPGVGHVPMHGDPALVAETILQTTSATGEGSRIP